MNADEVLERLERMSESRHDYDIGHWWNAEEES